MLRLFCLDRERELASQVISSTYTRACHLLYESNIPSLSSALKYSLQTTFTGLSAILKKNQGKLKFEALAILAHLLPDLPSQVNFVLCLNDVKSCPLICILDF